MSIQNISRLLDELELDITQGLFVIGAERSEDIPFDLNGTLLVADLTEEHELLTNLGNVLATRFGAKNHISLFGITATDIIATQETIAIHSLGADGAAYMAKQQALSTKELDWVLMYQPDVSEAAIGSAFTLQPLIDVVAALRAPDGCSWDRLQTHSTLRRYLLEEVYEVLEAIDNRDTNNLREELGDVLLQIVFHARLAEEQGLFTVQDIIDDITAKMIRRHPHVFAKATSKELAETQLNWEALKSQEPGHDKKTLLGGISKGLPALLGAQKLQEKAIAQKDYEHAELEGGDVLFSLINLLRWYKIGGENALNRTNNKFRHRFAHVERCVKDSGKSWKDFSLEELDLFWESAKVSEQKHSLK